MISILLIGGLALLLATSLGAVIDPDERRGTGERPWIGRPGTAADTKEG
jgi:hypothetical protein